MRLACVFVSMMVAMGCSGGGGATPPGAEEPAPPATTSRIPAATRCLSLARAQPWGTAVKEIPANSIDVGVFRNVPYACYRAGDYEINVYGDPLKPAGVEIGVYGRSVLSHDAKVDCREYMRELLPVAEDKEIVGLLNLSKEVRRREGMVFEVTPPNAADAYAGFWISVYDPLKIGQVRRPD